MYLQAFFTTASQEDWTCEDHDLLSVQRQKDQNPWSPGLCENCVPESCCRDKMLALASGVEPRISQSYACSLASCRKVRWLGCPNAANPASPGLMEPSQLHGNLSSKAATKTQFLGNPDFHAVWAKTTDITKNKLFPWNSSWRWDLEICSQVCPGSATVSGVCATQYHVKLSASLSQ